MSRLHATSHFSALTKSVEDSHEHWEEMLPVVFSDGELSEDTSWMRCNIQQERISVGGKPSIRKSGTGLDGSVISDWVWNRESLFNESLLDGSANGDWMGLVQVAGKFEIPGISEVGWVKRRKRFQHLLFMIVVYNRSPNRAAAISLWHLHIQICPRRKFWNEIGREGSFKLTTTTRRVTTKGCLQSLWGRTCDYLLQENSRKYSESESHWTLH